MEMALCYFASLGEGNYTMHERGDRNMLVVYRDDVCEER